MRTMLDVIIDALERGDAPTVYELELPADECLRPSAAGVCAAYCDGCRCRRCRYAWRAYRRAYNAGVRLPMGRLYGRAR